MPTTIDTNKNSANLKEVAFNPFAGPKLINAIPTTESQLEIWLSCVIGGADANRSYNQSVSLNLTGILNRDAIVYTLEKLIERHEVFRSTFSSDGKFLCIHDCFPLSLELVDVSHLSRAEQEDHVTNVHRQDAKKTFDLQNGPLFRTYLIKLSDNNHILKISAHHIVCDGWSFRVILENIGKIYSAKVNNEPLNIEPVVPFSLYAKQVAEHSKSENFKQSEEYWLEQFKDEVPILNVHTDNPRPSLRTFKSNRNDYNVSKELIEKVKEMGAKSNASLISTLIAAFETYLHLITNQSTVVLGVPTAGQSASGNYELVGHCVNLLPLKSKPSSDRNFEDYLLMRRSEILDAYDYQQFTFGTLLKKINIARDSSRIPLVPIVLNVDMGIDTKFSLSGLKHSLANDPRDYENFEIFLNITGAERSLTFEWSYNSYLFQSSTINRMMNDFQNLLEQVVAHPKIKIKDISFNSHNQLQQVHTWNSSNEADYPKDKIVTEFIEEATIKHSLKTAIYFQNQEISYSELQEKSNQMANYLIWSGVKKGNIVGLLVDRSIEMVVSLLAILKSGAAYLPLDPQYPQARLKFMLENSAASHLIVSQQYTHLHNGKAEDLVPEEIWPDLENFPRTYPSVDVNGSDLAYVLYTSGSTGKPKGVQIEHHSLTNFLLSVQEQPGISSEDRFLAITTISFDIAGTELFLPLISGASIRLADSLSAKDGRELLRILEDDSISIMQATPTTWRMVLAAGWDKKLALKIICTGEAFPKDLAENLLTKGSEVWNGYGPSETTVWSSLKQIRNTTETISIGRPIANTQFYILDEQKRHTAIGAPGEIYIAGEGLARGYLNNEDLTSEKFVNNPFSTASDSKMYSTGDLGYFQENGEIVCLGRIDSQLKIRGHRIETGEIEYSLIQQPGVKDAVVISRGENKEDQYLVAYIVPEETNPAWNDDVILIDIPEFRTKSWRNALEEILPNYMIPNLFLGLNHFSITDNGKIDRKNLPLPVRDKITNQSIAPRDENEQLIHDIWAEALSIESISVTSNFFELGGHSLTAVRVMLNLEKKTGIKLPMSLLFEASTIQLFAKEIAPKDEIKKNNNSIKQSKQIENQLIVVPTIAPQTEIWAACILGGDDANRSYNLSFYERLTGDLNETALKRALEEVLSRHESLRSTFSHDGTQMLIKSNDNLDYVFEDLSSLPLEIKNAALNSLLKKNADTAFDLFNGPLIKTLLIRLNENEYILSITVHHIVCDGLSGSILMRELSELYSLFSQNQESTLLPAAKYSDFALKKNEYYRTPNYQKIEQFWIEQFQEEVPILNLPVDTVRPDIRTYKGSRIYYEIDSNIGNKLKAFGFKNNCSSSISLRVAFEVFLSAICKQKKIVLGLPFAGQFAEDNSNLIGHCVNLLPIIAEVDSRLTFSEYLVKRKAEILNTYNYYDITFSSLLNKIDVYRNSSRVPLTPVFLNVHSEAKDYKFYDLANQQVPAEKEFETFELAINIDDLPSGMTIRWDFNTSLFQRKTIENFQLQFEKLLDQIGKNPDIAIHALTSALNTYSDNNVLLEKSENWNSTSFAYKNIPVSQLISEKSRQYPHKTAISSGETEISYRNLEQQSNQFANYLIEEGVQKGDIVGLLMDRSIEMVIVLIAIMKSGATYLPLDPIYPEERIEYMLKDSCAKFLVASKNRSQYSSISKLIIIDEKSEITHVSDEYPTVSISGKDLAYILYTSGSTGRPKGVLVENHSFSNFLLSMQREPGISDQDILLAVTTISFDIAALELFLPLISGAQIILAPSNAVKDGNALLRLIKKMEVTIMQATPITWTMLLESGWDQNHPLKVLCGGEAFPKRLAERLLDLDNEIWNMYGPTETTIWSSIKRISNNLEPITIGTPIANTQIYILDDALNPSAIGSPGEIYIAGTGVARGYLNRAELTAEKFLENPFSRSGEGKMYRTGDMGYYLENGEIVCLGRTDDQVKLHGFRIELGEIEYILSNQPDIKDSIVIINEANPSQRSLIAYVLLNEESSRPNDQSGTEKINIKLIGEKVTSKWKKTLSSSLPAYMIPNHYISINYFPTTKNGKINRRALPLISLNALNEARVDYIEPRNEMEKLVLKVWSEQLGLKKMSIKDNFFESGGNSLMAIRLMLQLEKETGIKLPISTLFESPTIEELAKMFTGEKTRTKWHSLVAIKTSGTKTPLYLVHGGGYNILTFEAFSKYMDPEQPIYALQGLGLYDKSKLLNSIEEIARFYVSEVLDNDPVGPYCLGGYSSGGILAFEIARQLIEKGKHVTSLAMLDTSYEENYSGKGTVLKSIKFIGKQFSKSLFYVGSLVKHPIKTARYLKQRVGSQIPVLHKNELIQYEDEINDSYAIAFKNHKMRPLQVKVDLFRVTTRVYYIDDPKHYGWTKYAKKGVQVHEVCGEHNTFLLPPHEKQFAKILQNVIDRNDSKI